MTVKTLILKWLVRQITTGSNSAMNQSEFGAITCNLLKAREKSRVHGAIGFGLNIVRAVFKLLSKVITWLRLLRLVIGLKDSRQFFNQWESKPKPFAPCTRDFSRASSEFQVIPRNCDWFISLSAPVVIGRCNCFGFGFSTVFWKPRY